MYKVFDSEGSYIKSFPTYKAAYTFLIMSQRYDWKIIES